MTKLEIKMAGYLTRLYLLEKMEGGDAFYFELGQDLKKDLEKVLTKKQVVVAKEMASRQYNELDGDGE